MKSTERYTPEQLMRLALAQAERGLGRTRPNPAVGCVIVKAGKVIGTGYHARAGTAHAEVVALRAAGALARGADVYITLEPCTHTGRTGPCVRELVAAGVRKVVVGTLDPNPLVHAKGVRYLRRHGVAVAVGLLAAECRQQNQAFAHYIKHHRPLVVAKLAESLDGKIATTTGESRWVTGPQARHQGHLLRNVADGIMVGVGTIIADNPRLTCRVRGGRDPIRIVVDSHARTSPRALVVQSARQSTAPTWIFTTDRAPLRRRRALERAGAEVIVCREHRGRVDLRDVLSHLGRRELLSVLVEGGPSLLGALFDHGLIDQVHAFVAPRIIGGREALSAVGGVGRQRLVDCLMLRNVEVRRAGRDLWLWGSLRSES